MKSKNPKWTTCTFCGTEIQVHAVRKVRYCDTCFRQKEHGRQKTYYQEHIQEKREKGKEYSRQYRKENPEKIAALNQKNYWKDPEARREVSRQYRKNHPEWRRETHRKWREAHPGYYAESSSKYYYQNREQRRELLNARNRDYSKLPKYRENKRKNLVAYRARLAHAPGEWTVEQFKALCDELDWCCYYCGEQVEKMTVDHAIPLSRGGSNDITNIIPACGPCNYSKQDKTVEEFLAWREQKGIA